MEPWYPLVEANIQNDPQKAAKLRESVLTMTEQWQKAGFVEEGFAAYVRDEETVAFPWTMIDKITPRPSEQIADDLEALAVDDAGNRYELAPDPMKEEIQEQLKDIVAEKIETMFREMLAGPGAVKATVHKYVGGEK